MKPKKPPNISARSSVCNLVLVCIPEMIPYPTCLHKMQSFTAARQDSTADEMWLVQHPEVYTLGVRGAGQPLAESIRRQTVQSDRGGLITWHGPGQIVLYWLADLRRLGIGPRVVVNALEGAVITFLASFGCVAKARVDAPGVYVDDQKIASVGLRVRGGCSYHGIALNVNNDLSAFNAIAPCGLQGVRATSCSALGIHLAPQEAGLRLVDWLSSRYYQNLRTSSRTFS